MASWNLRVLSPLSSVIFSTILILILIKIKNLNLNLNLSPAFRSGREPPGIKQYITRRFHFWKGKGVPPYLVPSGMFSLVSEGTLREWP